MTEVTDIDEKLLTLLGNRATPLPNPFDSDAVYNNESGQSLFDGNDTKFTKS